MHVGRVNARGGRGTARGPDADARALRAARSGHSPAAAIVLAALLALPALASAATYHVRPDGGTAQQCDGTQDRAYPGKGTGVACAWSHPFIALPPDRPARIAGGDTLLIAMGNYMMGFGAPETERCRRESAHECVAGAVPSGPDARRPTRILGAGHDGRCARAPELWGTGGARSVLRLDGSNHVELACLELTDRSPCIKSHNHKGNAPGETSRCPRGEPSAPWAEAGIVAKDSRNVVLKRLNIHGLAANGIRAGRLRDWRLEHVVLRANGWAGWDGNVGDDASGGSSNSGRITFSGGEIAWNGCAERYPSTEIFGCWAQQHGGYGDGLGTAKTGGDWVFEDVHVHHNTSDGLDLLYLDGTGSVTIRRVRAERNAGNQIKTAGPALIENSVLVGDCAYFTGMRGANLVERDHCRASGNTVSITHRNDSLVVIRNNTITGQGDCLLLTVDGSRNARAVVQNNAFIGDEEWKPGKGGRDRSCAHYAEKSEARIEFANNLFWQVKGGFCPAGNVCNRDPRLAPPANGRFNPQPRAGSALVGAGAAVSGVDHDFHRKSRPRGRKPDIGAIQL